jgi:hypothetical protein
MTIDVTPTDARTRAAEDLANRLKSFEVPSVSNKEPERCVTEEISNGVPLILDSHNMTVGMKVLCQMQLGQKYNHWQDLDRQFAEIIAPYSGALIKFNNLESDVERNEQEIANAEEIVLRQWRHGEAFKFAKAEYQAANEAYQSFRDREGQREPKVVSWLGKAAVLILIGSVEWLINYEAFSATFGVPFLAVGFTIAVALAVAVSSHWHGIVFKQREFHFGDHLTRSAKMWRLVWILFVTLALIGALVFVGWNRYIWAMEILSKTSSSGPIIIATDQVHVDVTQKVLMSLLGNIIVWIVGTALVYWMHDPNPEFADAFVRRKKWGKKYGRFKAKIDDHTRAFVARHQREIAALRSQLKAEWNRDPHAGQMAKYVADVRKADTRIEQGFRNAMTHCMEQYRVALYRRDKSSEVQVFKEGAIMSVSEYLRLPLTARPREVLTASAVAS